ncbi:MAG: hypothetical protein LBB81_08475 [Treponema sp.]|nr:hypothetical protein [Treponema sp.]
MKKVYRSVEFWKSALLTMADNSFYELIRGVFGKIKTPFNKTRLVNDLETFLLREDIQKTIAGYIDENDAKIIAAVSLFGECAPGELESFFSGELSYARLQDIIVNLEERFILYRFNLKDLSHNYNLIALNPVLSRALEQYVSNIPVLLPVVPAAGQNVKSNRKMIFDDLFLAGLLSFVSQEDSFFRDENLIRKKTKERGLALFPDFDLGEITGALRLLGLFYRDQDKLIPDIKLFENFGLLNRRERTEYCAAALLLYRENEIKENILAPLYRAKIRNTADYIHNLLDSIDIHLQYPVKTLNKLARIYLRDTGINVNIDGLIDVLEITGLLTAASPDLTQSGPALEKITENRNTDPCIGIDSNSSVLVYPQVPYTDAVSLALILCIKETGSVVRFELNRDCAIRAFDRGVKADEILEMLARLSCGKLDETLVWTLNDWEKRYNEVSLKKGVILNLCEDKRYLVKTRSLSALIRETIAPGVYLLDEDSIDEASSVLHSAGVEIIARGKKSQKNDHGSHHYYQRPASFDEKKIKVKDGVTSEAGYNTAAQIEHFYTILERMNPDTAEKTQLSARIERRLILCEDQLKDADIRYEKLEARFLDYAGKQNIARQAITQKTPVELVCISGKNEERIFGIPKALKKKDNELILEIETGEKEDTVHIPLGKISLLRRIKKSIFEN